MNTPRRKKVAFFSPHAGIWPHALPESYLAKCLDGEIFDVSRIRCDGSFVSHCTVMEALSVGLEQTLERRAEICVKCKNFARILRPSYAGQDYVISAYLTQEAEAEAERIESGMADADLPDFIHMSVEVGRIAAYEVLLKFKKTSLDFTGEELAYYRTYIRNSLKSLLAFEVLFAEIQPDILLSYSPQYAVLGVCARYCEIQGVKVYFLEGSSNIDERYKALRVWDWTTFGLTNPALKYWDKLETYGLSPSDYARVEKHTHRLLNASSFSVYSEPVSGQFNMRSHFDIPEKAKVVLAAMSSYDEVFSAFVIGRFPANKYISNVFNDQLEWIRATITFFKDHPDLYLVIRIHPRTFPSKRNAVMAAQQTELAQMLADLPSNVKANYPTDKISIYDLYLQIDALVTGWSATGVEAMTFKVPVVTYDRNLPSYPSAIHYTGDSQVEYFANLLKAAQAGKSQSVADGAMAWLALYMSVGVVIHPTMLNDMTVFSRNKIGNFLYRGFNKLVPGLLKRFEAGRRIHLHAERRFNRLLETGATSLYDVPRFQ